MHKEADRVSVASGLKLNWKGIFDFEDLYKKMKYWLDFSGYGNEEKSFKEVKYIERIKPNGKQIEIKWECEKNQSDYFSYFITITFFVIGLKDVEVQNQGQKLKMNSGEVEIRFSGDLIKNRQGKWTKGSIIKKIYENFVVRERTEEYKKAIYDKLYSFHDEVKSYLNLHRF